MLFQANSAYRPVTLVGHHTLLEVPRGSGDLYISPKCSAAAIIKIYLKFIWEAEKVLYSAELLPI